MIIHFVWQIFFAFRFWPWPKWKMTKGQTPWLGFSQRFSLLSFPWNHCNLWCPDHQVHFPQVWILRKRSEVWRHLRSPAQHYQWKNLRLSLVLVPLACGKFNGKMISSMWASFNFAGDHKDSDDISSQRSCPAMSSCNPSQGSLKQVINVINSSICLS